MTKNLFCSPFYFTNVALNAKISQVGIFWLPGQNFTLEGISLAYDQDCWLPPAY